MTDTTPTPPTPPTDPPKPSEPTKPVVYTQQELDVKLDEMKRANTAASSRVTELEAVVAVLTQEKTALQGSVTSHSDVLLGLLTEKKKNLAPGVLTLVEKLPVFEQVTWLQLNADLVVPQPTDKLKVPPTPTSPQGKNNAVDDSARRQQLTQQLRNMM